MSITINKLGFSIGNKPLLTDIDLTIDSGEFTALIGPNGAGKSTLLKLISNHEKKYTGAIHLNEQPLDSYSLVELSQIRAVMTQSYELPFDFAVSEVIEMGTFPYQEMLEFSARQNITKEVMEFLGILDLADRNFLSLSGGEKQRTQLGRVLAQLWYQPQKDHNLPRFLILDEPTSSLDLFHQYNILSLCKNLCQRNIGVLAVIHDLALAASFANKVVLVKDGSVVIEGNPDNVLNHDYLSQVYNIEAQLIEGTEGTYPALMVDRQ